MRNGLSNLEKGAIGIGVIAGGIALGVGFISYINYVVSNAICDGIGMVAAGIRWSYEAANVLN